MIKAQTCGSKTLSSSIGLMLAQEIKNLYPDYDIKQIATILGAHIIYEKPIEMGSVIRISEYRKKHSQIVIFHKEYEQEAIAHELFHHLEKIRKIKLSRKESEVETEKFVSLLVC